MLRQRVRNVFIISAELNLLLGTSDLSQKVWMRVEQNFSLFFSGRSQGKRRLIFASATLAGCSTEPEKPDAGLKKISARSRDCATVANHRSALPARRQPGSDPPPMGSPSG